MLVFRLLYCLEIKKGGSLNISMVNSSSTMYKSQVYTEKSSGNGSLKDQIKLDKLTFKVPSRESLQKKMVDFSSIIGKKFQEAGINVTPEPVLISDSEGHIRVAGSHPDKSKIEQLFADNPELQQQFVKISSDSTLLRGAEHYSSFVKDYERLQGNTSALSALVNSEINRNKAPFYLRVTSNNIEPFFGVTELSA
jgi:hypothetical protein